MLEILLESFERLMIEQTEIAEDNVIYGNYYFDNVIVPLKEIITNVITNTKMTDEEVLQAFRNVGGSNQMSVLFEWYLETMNNYLENYIKENNKSGREIISE